MGGHSLLKYLVEDSKILQEMEFQRRVMRLQEGFKGMNRSIEGKQVCEGKGKGRTDHSYYVLVGGGAG
jgi:hypothetical protein